MKITSHEFYTFQHRRTHESPWRKLKPIKPVKILDDWCFSSWDHFGFVINPLNTSGDKYLYKGTDQCYKVWCEVGKNGFYDLKYAKLALKRLQKASREGEFDSTDNYRTKCQSLRYDFRIVKVTCFDDIVEYEKWYDR